MIVGRVIRAAIRNAILLSMTRLPRGPHITRYYMYRRLEEVVRHEHASGRILSISGSLRLCTLFELHDSKITEVNYPDTSILHLPFPDDEFHHVVSDQVLEHVEGDPQTAIDETWRVIQPGGLAVHTTCFVNPLHLEPGDFWRFSPDALRFLCRRFSRIVDVGGWGNPYVWLVTSLGLRHEGIPEARWHPLHKLAMLNDERWPIVTWVVAEK